MYFKEPKIEFVTIESEDVVMTSGGAAIDVCAAGSVNDDAPCFAPAYTE